MFGSQMNYITKGAFEGPQKKGDERHVNETGEVEEGITGKVEAAYFFFISKIQ